MPGAFAQEANQSNLPDLGEPTAQSASVTPNVNAEGAGFSYRDNINGKLLSVSPQYNRQNGAAIGGSFASPVGQNMAAGILLMLGEDRNEWLANVGVDLSMNHRMIFSLGQLRQKLNFNFVSGSQKAEVTQDNGAVSYQYLLGKDWLNAAEVNAYISNADSINLSDKTFFTDTASLYELWNDPRRIAGGRVLGAQGRLVFTPTARTTFKVGMGAERLTYDYLTGDDSTTRATGSAELLQRLDHDFNFRASVNAAASQNRYALGLGKSFKDGSQFGIDVSTIEGRDGVFNDNRVQLTYTQSFGGNSPSMNSPIANNLDFSNNPTVPNTAKIPSANAWASSLVDQVSRRPSFLPAQVVAKVDSTATPTRLIAIDKTALPNGSTIANVTGILTVPIGTSVSGIASVTLNGSAFSNSGQYAVSGSTNLVINPNLISQPNTTDTYVVTMNNTTGGGTTLATVTVSHGSTRIDSVVISSGQVAPTISSFSAISKTYGDASFPLTAPTSNSAGAFTYTSSNTAVATISGSTVTIVGAGASTITATQAANGAYSSGTTTATLTVVAASQATLTASASATSIVSLTGTSTLSTSGGSGSGAVTYSSTGGCTISGSTLTAGSTVGTCTVTATKAADANYSATTATVNITVTAIGTQATPTFSPAAGAITFGSTVTITSSGADAIYYTTDGSTPTTSSTNQATMPLVINAAVTVKALAVKAGYTNSTIGTASYTQASATAPSSIVLAVGSTNPVGGVTNVAIPAAGSTDTTGAVTGWTATSAANIKFTVTNGGSATSSITINGSAYTSGANYTITSASTLTVVVTTTETGKSTAVRTFTISVAAASTYITYGGLTWAPITTRVNWTTASTACSAGWRLPTKTELSGLYAARLSGITPAGWPPAGWQIDATWASDLYSAGTYYFVNLSDGYVGHSYYTNSYYLSCVQ